MVADSFFMAPPSGLLSNRLGGWVGGVKASFSGFGENAFGANSVFRNGPGPAHQSGYAAEC